MGFPEIYLHSLCNNTGAGANANEDETENRGY